MSTRYLLSLTFALVILFPAAPSIQAQRCGGYLLLYMRDGTGAVINPSEYESVKVSANYETENVRDLKDAKPSTKELPGDIKSFMVRTECGAKLMQFQLRYKNETMTIRVLNIAETVGPVVLKGALFKAGTYEVDLGWRPAKNIERDEALEAAMKDPDHEPVYVIKEAALKKVD